MHLSPQYISSLLTFPNNISTNPYYARDHDGGRLDRLFVSPTFLDHCSRFSFLFTQRNRPHDALRVQILTETGVFINLQIVFLCVCVFVRISGAWWCPPVWAGCPISIYKFCVEVSRMYFKYANRCSSTRCIGDLKCRKVWGVLGVRA